MEFLYTRVKNPDIHDYKILTRLKQNIRDTTKLTLTIEPDENPKWWVDSLFAVCPDMKNYMNFYDNWKRSIIHSNL